MFDLYSGSGEQSRYDRVLLEDMQRNFELTPLASIIH